jgi:hypothetical protein
VPGAVKVVSESAVRRSSKHEEASLRRTDRTQDAASPRSGTRRLAPDDVTMPKQPERARTHPQVALPADLRQSVEHWFLDNGVPHFIRGFSARRGGRVPVLLLLLFVVLAFEASVEPWLPPDAPLLLVAPAVVIVLTWCFAPVCAPWLGIEWRPRPQPWSIAVRTAVTVTVLWRVGLHFVPFDAFVDFVICLLALWSSALTFRSTLWDPPAGKPRDRRASVLVALLVVAVVVFGLEGSLFPSFRQPLDDAVGSLGPGWGPLPQALPALPVVVAVFALAIQVSRSERGLAAYAPTSPDVPAFVPVAPLLVLVFGGETAVLPEAMGDGWAQGALPVSLLVGLALVSRARPQRAPLKATVLPNLDASRIKGTITNPSPIALAIWIGLLVCLYPALVTWLASVRLGGHTLSGVTAFAFTAAINVAYLGIVWLITSFGLDHVASWAGSEALANIRSVVMGIARGLPLLLIVTAFSVLSADVWQAVAAMSIAAYVALLALILALTGTAMLINAKRELDDDRDFRSWHDVRRHLERPGARREPSDPCQRVLQALDAARPRGTPPTPPLRKRQSFNALAVLTVYQAFIFVPLLAAAGALFWVIGRLAVPVSVAGSWIYGDGSPPTVANQLAERSFFAQPWTRVGLLLGTFSLLYVATQVLSSEEQRKDFFRGADQAVRQRFALLVAYNHLFPPPAADAAGATPPSRGRPGP